MIRIPKTGSTSIVRGIFGGIDHSDTVFHGPPPTEWRNHFTFGFVRNPFDRLVSAYLMSKTYRTDNPQEKAFKQTLTIDGVLVIISNEQQCLTDEDYFSKLQRHVIPMTHPFFGLQLANKIYQFEDFAGAYMELANKFQIETSEIPHFRRSIRGHYSDYFSIENASRAKQLFRDDCEQFGYQY